MAISSIPNTPGLIPTKPQFHYHRYNVSSRTVYNNRAIQHVSAKNSRASIQYVSRSDSALRFSMFAGRSDNQLTIDDDSPEDSFLLNLIKEALWAVKSVASFLVEQPSQLKYIQWPSFQTTLKTAMLTLVLMALLIVALASVDAALSFVLAYLTRRPM